MKQFQDHERLGKARSVLWQITQALYYLESVQVAHRDIKPENVVVCDSDSRNITVKLCDFGWAIWFKPGHHRSTLCGTAEYCPPEMLANHISYSAEYVDRWMLGVLALELVHQSTPFTLTESCDSDVDSNDLIFDKIRKFRAIAVDHEYSDHDYRGFIASLMQLEPSDRISAERAAEHNFLQPVGRCRQVLSHIQGPSVAQRRQIFQQTLG